MGSAIGTLTDAGLQGLLKTAEEVMNFSGGLRRLLEPVIERLEKSR
jgi:hypothetical protein